MKFSVVRHPDRVIVRIPTELMPQFKEIVQRATNLWPDASPEVKEFADEITNDGIIMQDYSSGSVTNQPKFCSTLLTSCRSGCKGNFCKVKNLTQST